MDLVVEEEGVGGLMFLIGNFVDDLVVLGIGMLKVMMINVGILMIFVDVEVIGYMGMEL